ncbi:hypothetical protein SLS59_006498 [Nothophoma quercina]|uniref:Protein kinase domain-containing protein n=1 Tax=Nothophoma quercina TaxID=749835 RepID=A0ABR3R3Q1_9PLEO
MNELEWSAFDRTTLKFIPEGVVDRLVHENAVATSLRINRHSLEEADLIEFILKQAKKAFSVAILAQANTNEAMRWLQKNGICDKDLPVRRQTREWSKSWRRDFYEQQWKVFVPIFSVEKPMHEFQEAQILPFIGKPVATVDGSFGEITQYILHKDHILPKPQVHTSFAVKRIKGGNVARDHVERWEKEVEALRDMETLKQNHIIRFITAFRRRKRDSTVEHYIMFEWADGGNLRDLWRSMPRPTVTSSIISAMITQLVGLAEALCAAHYIGMGARSYRHGNLKPENIFVFKTSEALPTLKIGDWGEAKFHEKATELRPEQTLVEYATLRYEAPEAVTGLSLKWLSQPIKRRSRLYDIWAMGCITLEFMIWLLYGVDELGRFHTEMQDDLSTNEPYYQIRMRDGVKIARVHSVAVRWMEHMAKEHVCQPDTALGDLLDIVRNGLLVVKLPRRMESYVTPLSDSKQRSVGLLTVPAEQSTMPSEPDIPTIIVTDPT